ncbi:MAG: 1-deoxy-D-xylulose-5-phosphate synthase [Clostridiales bacterium]|nr:1-deoxy-D-xylulose-5-phosphate synthase [Clostridiales bacterium]
MRLEQIESPRILKDMSIDDMTDLAGQIRSELVATVARRGGHLASNLGVVELTLALHRVFDMPEDKLVFDVGHQSYVHKLLTGRYSQFHTLRTYGGLSGFPKRSESPYDAFETGHASTAISAALGMARARDQLGQRHHVIALVGDGALTGGMCYEALNDAGSGKTRMIVILNDNEMSISRNVGALSRHLTNLRVSRGWNDTKIAVRGGLRAVPVIGKPLAGLMSWLKDSVKSIVMDPHREGFFDALGFRYFGPIDGHDLPGLIHTLESVKKLDEPVVVHVLTQKGHGYGQAEKKPEIFHGTPPFYVETGDRRVVSSLPSYGTVMAKTLSDMAESDPRIIAVTAAMPSGTGLIHFQRQHPDRMLDVGIAEEHAVTMCAGMAACGMKPYFAVYATFFQRGFDQMIHEVCMQNLPVTLLLDRAGLVGEDGETHHGVWDLASMLPVPNLTILAPRDIGELSEMLRWTQHHNGPCAIRYGRTSVDLSARYPNAGQFTPGKWETLEAGDDCTLLAVGSMVETSVRIRDLLAEKGICARLVNCASVKPMDEALLREVADKPVFTLEEHVRTGGFGAAVCSFAAENGLKAPAICFALPDAFVPHGNRTLMLDKLGLSDEKIAKDIQAALRGRNA